MKFLTISQHLASRAAAIAAANAICAGLAQAQTTYTYQYDAQGRLTRAHSDFADVAYAYDAAGNRQAQTTSNVRPHAGSTAAVINQNATQAPIQLSAIGITPTAWYIQVPPGHGAATVIGSIIYYTPFQGFIGPDTIKFSAQDASNPSNVINTDFGTIFIHVREIPPIAQSIPYTVLPNSQNNAIPISTIAGTPTHLTVQSPTNQHGTVSVISSNMSLSYTPQTGFSGTDAFQYTVSNGTLAPSTATITVTVNYPTARWDYFNWDATGATWN